MSCSLGPIGDDRACGRHLSQTDELSLPPSWYVYVQHAGTRFQLVS